MSSDRNGKWVLNAVLYYCYGTYQICNTELFFFFIYDSKMRIANGFSKAVVMFNGIASEIPFLIALLMTS